MLAFVTCGTRMDIFEMSKNLQIGKSEKNQFDIMHTVLLQKNN